MLYNNKTTEKSITIFLIMLHYPRLSPYIKMITFKWTENLQITVFISTDRTWGAIESYVNIIIEGLFSLRSVQRIYIPILISTKLLFGLWSWKFGLPWNLSGY